MKATPWLGRTGFNAQDYACFCFSTRQQEVHAS